MKKFFWKLFLINFFPIYLDNLVIKSSSVRLLSAGRFRFQTNKREIDENDGAMRNATDDNDGDDDVAAGITLIIISPAVLIGKISAIGAIAPSGVSLRLFSFVVPFVPSFRFFFSILDIVRFSYLYVYYYYYI